MGLTKREECLELLLCDVKKRTAPANFNLALIGGSGWGACARRLGTGAMFVSIPELTENDALYVYSIHHNYLIHIGHYRYRPLTGALQRWDVSGRQWMPVIDEENAIYIPPPRCTCCPVHGSKKEPTDDQRS